MTPTTFTVTFKELANYMRSFVLAHPEWEERGDLLFLDMLKENVGAVELGSDTIRNFRVSIFDKCDFTFTAYFQNDAAAVEAQLKWRGLA